MKGRKMRRRGDDVDPEEEAHGVYFFMLCGCEFGNAEPWTFNSPAVHRGLGVRDRHFRA